MADPSQYETAGGAPGKAGVLTPSPGAGRRPDPPPRVPTLAAALVAALGAMTDVPKKHTAKAGSFEYDYADLADVLAVVRPVLAAHSLGVVQDVSVDDDRVRVTTILVHPSGDRMLFGPVSLSTGRTPQAIGSAVTYARRYGLLAALSVATVDDDDDGQDAGVVPPPPLRPPSGQGRAAPGGSSPSPSGDDPTGIPPWHVDPPDPLHAEQVDDWLVRLGRLPDGELKNELRLAANRAGWVARYALTGTVANAVLDVWESRLDDVEQLEQEQQLPMTPDPPSQDPYEAWTAPRLRAELGRRGVDLGPVRKMELVETLYRLDSERDES